MNLLKEFALKQTDAAVHLLDEYVKNTKAQGLPGEEALKFCVDYLKANQK